MVKAVTPIPFVKARFFDRCGKPLTGGKVYTYEANTTTPKVTYKDPYGLTPNTNPIILDAAGEADIYLDGTYRIRITDRNDVLVNDVAKIGSWFSDNLQDTLDNISVAMDDAIAPKLQALDDAINTAAAAGAGANGWIDEVVSTQYNRTLRDKLTDFSVSIKDFGAKGDNDQTLQATDYYSDESKAIRITQQTADGIAINKAIKYLRSVGGGKLHIPKGIYRTYGYLEPIDFPCVIYGDGSSSLIKNCDNSPTDRSGYGIFVVQPQNYEEITFCDLKLDGNADVRTKPTGEHRLYPLAVLGKPCFRMINITSVNSPIDCFYTSYKQFDSNVYVKSLNCTFDRSFRNVVSLVAGDNQYHVNMTATRGGWVYGGTNPRMCLDIEPNLANLPITNLNFVNCTFAFARSQVVGGHWGEAKFTNCTFSAEEDMGGDTEHKGPWLLSLTDGQFLLSNCKFQGHKKWADNVVVDFGLYAGDSPYKDTQYLKIHDCHFENCGFYGKGIYMELVNCTARNSLYPFVFTGVSGTNEAPYNNIYIRNLRLINVFNGLGHVGIISAFNIDNNVKGIIDVDGVTAEIDLATLPKLDKTLFTSKVYFGIHLAVNGAVANKKRVVLKNIYSEGYYRRLPSFLGAEINESNYRDWLEPNLPPENTIKLTTAVTGTVTDGAVSSTVSGTTATGTLTNKAITGTATENSNLSNRILGGRSTAIYHNCTMWGNYD